MVPMMEVREIRAKMTIASLTEDKKSQILSAIVLVFCCSKHGIL
jgi:hypothetical protein